MNGHSFATCRRLVPAMALVLLAPVTPSAVAGATFRVGSDGIPPCTHANLPAAVQAAKDNGPGLDQIFLSDSINITAIIDLNNTSVEIVGGFADCNADLPGGGQTSVTVFTNPGFWVHGGSSTRTVNFQGLQVIRQTSGGRLLEIAGPANVSIYNSLFSNGQGDHGANIRMAGSVILFLDDNASIYSGDATGNGGGIHCSGGGTILLVSGRIGDNNALGDGGGVYMDDCTMNAFAGTTASFACPTGGSGIVCNRAESEGGGVYALNGSSVNLIGSRAQPALVAENDADEGGGLYLTGAGTTGDASSSWIVRNGAPNLGGGVLVRSNASFLMDSPETDCRGAECSLLANNSSGIIGGKGGGLAVDSGADAIVRQTTIRENNANAIGSAVYVEGAGSTVQLEGVISYGQIGSLNESFYESALSGSLRVAFSTIREDTVCCKGIFDTATNSTVEVFSSVLLSISGVTGTGRIFEEPIAAGETRFGDCILHQETTNSLPPPVDANVYEAIVSPTAMFASIAANDYRLRAGSQAIDFCDTFRYTPATTDIDGQARGFDYPGIPNTPVGVYDLGADEYRNIFVGNFEPGDCSQWTSDTGGC